MKKKENCNYIAAKSKYFLKVIGTIQKKKNRIRYQL